MTFEAIIGQLAVLIAELRQQIGIQAEYIRELEGQVRELSPVPEGDTE